MPDNLVFSWGQRDLSPVAKRLKEMADEEAKHNGRVPNAPLSRFLDFLKKVFSKMKNSFDPTNR